MRLRGGGFLPTLYYRRDTSALLAPNYNTVCIIHNGHSPVTLTEHPLQVEDGLLLEGKLEEYQAAFSAADTSGDGLLGANTSTHHPQARPWPSRQSRSMCALH